MKTKISIVILLIAATIQSHGQVFNVTLDPNVRVMAPDFLGFNATTTIRNFNNSTPGTGWQETSLLNNIGRLNANSIRFPGGELANWWSTRRGWFKIHPELNGDYLIPREWWELPPLPNNVSDYERGVALAKAKHMFIINILTSDLAEQLGAIFEYCGNNLPLEYLEFGNEFYLNQRPFIDEFRDGIEYGQKASMWANHIYDDDLFPCLYPSCHVRV